MRALVVDTTEPAYNLALEETLFDGLTTGQKNFNKQCVRNTNICY